MSIRLIADTFGRNKVLLLTTGVQCLFEILQNLVIQKFNFLRLALNSNCLLFTLALQIT